MLIQALIERQIRTAMAEHGLRQLSLYPEDRGCAAPTAAHVLEIFAGLARHHLRHGDEHIKTFHPELTVRGRGRADGDGDPRCTGLWFWTSATPNAPCSSSCFTSTRPTVKGVLRSRASTPRSWLAEYAGGWITKEELELRIARADEWRAEARSQGALFDELADTIEHTERVEVSERELGMIGDAIGILFNAEPSQRPHVVNLVSDILDESFDSRAQAALRAREDQVRGPVHGVTGPQPEPTSDIRPSLGF